MGIKEGLDKYKDPRFSGMNSRFKGNKKSILFVSHISDLSGAPVSLSLIVKMLDKNKYHVVVALPEKGQIMAKLNIPNVYCQIYKDSILNKLFPSLKIYRILKERHIDLVYLNTSASIWAAKAAKLLRVPVISHIREDLRGVNNSLIRAKIRFCSDKIILISDWMKGFIRSNNAVVIHNTVDLSEFDRLDPDRIRLHFNLRGKTIVYAGSLEERKGVQYLIKAFPLIKAAVPDIRLLIVGKTLPGRKNYLGKLESMANDHDVIFAGSRPDVHDAISAADVIVVPSLNEAFGRIIIEAMACSKPVIATNVGGIPEIIENGKNGLLVPPADAKSIADAAIKLLSDRSFADMIAMAGRHTAEHQFNAKDQVNKIEAIMEKLLLRHRSPV